jgi:hypothetical protein
MRLASLIVVLCLAPGAALTVYSLVGMYQSITAGADVDSEKLRASMQLGFRWCLNGGIVAAALILLLVLYRLLRPRRRPPGS